MNILKTVLSLTSVGALLSVLTACSMFYVVPGYDPYVELDPPYIQQFQKPDTIGHTDPEQRWKDFQDCGVKNFNHGTLDINNRYPGMTSEDVTKRNKAIHDCIDNKGYIFIKVRQCVDGENNRLTGLCN